VFEEIAFCAKRTVKPRRQRDKITRDLDLEGIAGRGFMGLIYSQKYFP